MTRHETLLRHWKALADIENKRARETWGRPSGQYTPPAWFEPPEVTAARKRRDDQIAAWHAEGVSTAEIARRTGLVSTSITRILRIRRLADAQEAR